MRGRRVQSPLHGLKRRAAFSKSSDFVTVKSGMSLRCMVKSAFRPSCPSGRHLSPVSVVWSDWEYFYSPLDGMPVHHRVTPALNSPVPIYTPGWTEALLELSVLPKNTTQCPRSGLESGDERTNHEATAPPRESRLFTYQMNNIGGSERPNPASRCRGTHSNVS